jgi:hypothetical protein
VNGEREARPAVAGVAALSRQRGPVVYLGARYGRRAELQEYAATLAGLGMRVPAAWLREDHEWSGKLDPEGLARAQELAMDDVRDLERAHAVVIFTEEPTDLARVRAVALEALSEAADPARELLTVAGAEREAARITAAVGGYRRGGSLVELGIAIGMQKQVVIVGPAANVFCTLPWVARYADWTSAVAHLVKWRAAAEAAQARSRLALPQ